MNLPKCRIGAVLLACALLVAPQLAATTLLHMDLAELAARSDKIFRGTVVDVEQGAIAVGGGEIPAVTYTLQVEEQFKGAADITKGEASTIELRMVGSIKQRVATGGVQQFSPFRDVPRLKMGGDYLLITTASSAAGLSVTVGLGQGAFTVFSEDKDEFAVNEFNNLGLGFDEAGPVAYSEIAAKIRALLGP